MVERVEAPAQAASAVSADAAALLRADGLSKRYGSVVAVNDVSFSIQPGEFFCLLGPSGCGKTTLMRMIAGFEAPDAGSILLAGTELSDIPPHRRPLNMMFQSYALFPHMSVAANVAFGLRQAHLPRAEIEARVAEMLDLVQMRHFAARRPEQLSGGQQQRVALARAIARKPRLLLLDEPLGALDRKLRDETRVELSRLQSELGIAFLMVTHDQDEAMALADRIAIMDSGRIVQVDAPHVVYEEPANRRVAEFMGDINLIEGRVLAGATPAGELCVAAQGWPLPLRVQHGASLPEGTPVAVAVRPEKMRMARTAPADATNVIRGTVADIGYLGDWSAYRIRTPEGALLHVAQANAERGEAGRTARAEEVAIWFAPSAAILLTQ